MRGIGMMEKESTLSFNSNTLCNYILSIVLYPLQLLSRNVRYILQYSLSKNVNRVVPEFLGKIEAIIAGNLFIII